MYIYISYIHDNIYIYIHTTGRHSYLSFCNLGYLHWPHTLSWALYLRANWRRSHGWAPYLRATGRHSYVSFVTSWPPYLRASWHHTYELVAIVMLAVIP